MAKAGLAQDVIRVGDYVRFAHLPEMTGAEVLAESDGLLEIEGFAGLFAPHLFVLVCGRCGEDYPKDGGPCACA